MGERLPSEYLDYLLGLLPDVSKIFEVYLLDALPPNARVAALQHSNVHAMARAADAVVLESRASAESDRSFPAINQLSLMDDDFGGDLDGSPSLAPAVAPTVAAVSRGAPPAAASGRPSAASSGRKPDPSLCLNHARWGKETYRCLKPSSCRMRRVVRPKPPQQHTPGNGPAGGRQ